MVRTAVACKIEMHEHFLGKLVSKTSSYEVFFYSLRLYVSHEVQLLHAIKRYS